MKATFRTILGFSLILFLASGAWSQAAAPKPLAFEDFIKIKRVTDAQLSPDGRQLAYVVTVIDKEANRGNSDIWLVPSQGGAARQLTASPSADFGPRWSPDGKTIAFISARSGEAQVWLISLDGGEARQLTRLAGGASGIVWSPKGTHLAFASSVFPDAADDAANRKRFEEAERSKVKARLFKSLLVRHWNVWSDGTRSHVFVVPAAGGAPVDVTPGDFDTPPSALGGTQDYVFSPDGAEIAFVRNVDPQFRLGLGTDNDVFTAPSGGGEIHKISPGRGNDNSPLYSPDGRFLAFKSMARPGFEADKLDLVLVDRKTGGLTVPTKGLDASAGEACWTADSKAVFFECEDQGRSAVYRLTAADGKIEKILSGHTLSSLSVSPDGQRLFFLKQALERPYDVWSYDLKTRKLLQLTDVNRELLAGLAMNPAEEFRFEGAGNDPIHGFLLKPPFFDPAKKYPLLMLIHGGPQGSFGDGFHYRWNAQMFAAPGYVVAMINFHGSTGYGQAFTDSISGDWGGKPYEDIVTGLGYLHGFYPFIDMGKNAAAGASYGGYMIDWIEGRPGKMFNCLVTHSGVYDLKSMYGATEELWFPEWEYRGTPWTSPEQYEKWSPSSYVKNFKTPCLVIHSANDFRVPLEQGLQFYTALQRQGVPSEFLYFPDEDHFISKPQNAELWWKTIHAWLAKYLK
jgi:dipeptidyl aminopeptidase/acylaminoacyl peptidase